MHVSFLSVTRDVKRYSGVADAKENIAQSYRSFPLSAFEGVGCRIPTNDFARSASQGLAAYLQRGRRHGALVAEWSVRVSDLSRRLRAYSRAGKTGGLRKPDAVSGCCGDGALANPAVLPKVIVHLFGLLLGQHHPINSCITFAALT